MFSYIISNRLVLRFPSFVPCVKCLRNLSTGVETHLSYSDEEKEKIIKLLNESSIDELGGYCGNKSRTKAIVTYRNKHGPFSSIDQILDINGFCNKFLQSLCHNILNNYSKPVEVLKPRIRPSSFITPDLGQSKIKSIQSVIGISLGAAHISWAGIETCNNKLVVWDFTPVIVSEKSKKLNEAELLDTAFTVKSLIPKADMYILESCVMSLGAQQPLNVNVNIQKLQLSAMLTVLLTPESFSEDKQHRVIHLRSALWPKLFGVLVGSERVSAQGIVSKILTPQLNSSDREKELEKPFSRDVIKNTIICSHYTPLMCSDEISSFYNSQEAVVRESMCSSLLLTMTFVELVCYKNESSLQYLKSTKFKK